MCRQVHSDSSGAPRRSLSSFTFFWFIRARRRVRPVHSALFGSFMRAQVVVWFILVRLVNLGAPRVSSGSVCFVCFVRAPPGGDRVHSRSFV